MKHDPVSSAINLFEHCWGVPNTFETSSQMGGIHPVNEMNHAGPEWTVSEKGCCQPVIARTRRSQVGPRF